MALYHLLLDRKVQEEMEEVKKAFAGQQQKGAPKTHTQFQKPPRIVTLSFLEYNLIWIELTVKAGNILSKSENLKLACITEEVNEISGTTTKAEEKRMRRTNTLYSGRMEQDTGD